MPDSFPIFGAPQPMTAASPAITMLNGSSRTRGQLDAARRVLTGSLARSDERAAAAAELIVSPWRADRDLGEDYLRGSVVITADMAQDVEPEPEPRFNPDPGIGENAYLFGGLVFDEGRAVMRLSGIGFLVLAFVALISVAVAAPGKFNRTGALFDQIEAMR